jgi:S-adenosylmethionine:tRNA ribosyltransferase-isomerase
MEVSTDCKAPVTAVLTADFDYDLPADRVAVRPTPQRDQARLLVMERGRTAFEHARFQELARWLPPGALLIVNDTRVIPARLRGRKPSGGAVEILLTRRISTEEWEALGRGLGRVAAGTSLGLGPGGRLAATLLEQLGGGRVRVRLQPGPEAGAAGVDQLLDEAGEVPLPPYIEAARRDAGEPAGVDDRERYQTVYAAVPGAVAAPTAGLHFTPALLAELRAAGHEIAALTLHVGPGTFRPVATDDAGAHRMDEERYQIPEPTAAAVERARADGRAIVAVGTTVVRALEASARAGGGSVRAGEAATDLFLLPGVAFQVVTDLVTNFHLPRSTLLMLVAAFAGRDPVLAAYREAIARGYRFYSYGDAMLIRTARS